MDENCEELPVLKTPDVSEVENAPHFHCKFTLNGDDENDLLRSPEVKTPQLPLAEENSQSSPPVVDPFLTSPDSMCKKMNFRNQFNLSIKPTIPTQPCEVQSESDDEPPTPGVEEKRGEGRGEIFGSF